MTKRLAFAVLAGSLWASASTAGDQGFHYDEKSAEPATYFAAIANLAHAVMFSGLGEELVVSPYERDDWLRRAGYVTRPPMPDMGIVGPVYAAAPPAYAKTPDFSEPETLRWKSDGFERTLDPGAQAWTLLKITSPEFHLQYHDLRENKIAALMMIPQARTQAEVLGARLRNADGLFAARSPAGAFLAPSPLNQAAVLWASASLIAAGSSGRDDYWHKAYADLTTADDYRPLADQAFAAVAKLPARAAAARAITIEALGRYALIVRDADKRRQALDLARGHADRLMEMAPAGLDDIALAIYGLVEAGRLFGDESYARAAADRFRDALKPMWNDGAGIFLAANGQASYTPFTAGAVVAALNAMRWYGPDDEAAAARQLYPRFFENAIVRSGLLRGSPLALVSKDYLDARPAAEFAHPALPDPKATGIAPVFAAKVAYADGKWSLADPAFETGAAMFLSNMLAIRSGAAADPFLPDDALKTIR